MPIDFQLFIEFHKWVDRNQNTGTDGLGNNANYIPLEALKKYWQEDRISLILNSCSHTTPIHVPNDDILGRYLRIFSILVYISTDESPKLHYINRFMEEAVDDNLLPFKSKPDALSNAVDGVQTFNLFHENQWLFSPVILGPSRLQKRELQLQSVLPFTVEEILSGGTGESTTVKKCKVDPSCGLLVSTIVLKEFDHTEIDFSFKNEVDSYINLENKVPPSVYEKQFLKYYGSFKKSEKAFIMLEYADQGSLLDFFNRNELPLERQEFCGLWWSLSKLLFGLEHIHSLEQNHRNSNFGTIRCVHQDIKPANIFVFREGDITEYSYQFKIGDFGMSSMALVRTTNKSIRNPADPSTKMYGAPELTYRYEDLENIDYGTLWEMDIWSFGCVLFECLVWMTCGSRGLDAFFRMRQKETDRDARHKAQGYSGCFHNGKSRIQAVDDMMNLVIERRRSFDDLSSQIGDLILREMLIPSAKRRLEARTLLPRFEKILEAETRPPEHPETSNPHSLISYTLDDKGDKAPPLTDQTRSPTSAKIQGYGLQHPEFTEPGRSKSVTGSRRSRHGRNRSRSSDEARESHGILTSPTSTETFHEEQSKGSTSVPVEVPVVSPSPIKAGHGALPAVKDLDHKQPGRTSVHGRPAEEPSPQMTGGNPSFGPANVSVGENVKGPRPYDIVKIPEVLQWIDDKKKGRVPQPLRDHERAMQEINGREQIFIVDDSSTMRKHHWNHVVDAVKALGYLVKHADPDGVELFFTSRPTKPKKSGGKETASLVRCVEEQGRTYSERPCNMESSLGTILEQVKGGLTKGSPWYRQPANPREINVYILTDAIWDGGTEVVCGVEQPIKSLWGTMQALGKTRTTVALQFIQFGDNALGEERLQYLDDGLGKELNFDIVDHRHHQRDGVWHMLVGPISGHIDRDNNVESRATIN